MRVGRWWVLGLATLAGVVAFLASDRDETVRSVETVPIAEAVVRQDLARVEAQAELAGYELVERVELATLGLRTRQVAADEGACVLAALGAWGHRRTAGLRPAAPSVLVHDGREGARDLGEVPRTRVIVACGAEHEGEPRLDPIAIQARVGPTYGEPDESGGAALVLLAGRGIPPPIADGAPVAVEREVITTEAALGSALLNTGATFLFVLLVGLMVEVSVTRTPIGADGEATLRRVSVAVPSAIRAALSEHLERADRGSLASAEALRAALLERIDDARAATWARWREPERHLGARLERVLSGLGRRGEARGAGYRERESGAVVITLIVQHRCELPDLPRVVDGAALREVLRGLLPADARDLLGLRVLVHPSDRAEALDAERLAAQWPELVPLDVGARRVCLSCEAVVAPPAGRVCLVCGEPLDRPA